MMRLLFLAVLSAFCVTFGCSRRGAGEVNVEHPLLEKLKKANDVAAKKFPSDIDTGFGRLGLILYGKLERSDYWCTPKNAVTFATTGGNGVHFSLLVRDGKVTEDSPVVVTIPSPGEEPNYIVGENLHDFLCLGFHRGYFALEQLPADRLFDAYGSATWRAETKADLAVGFGVDEHQRKLLGYLKEEFGLTPWKDVRKKFDRLQKEYLPLLQMP